MKAYLINPFKRTITEVEHTGGINSIYSLIDCTIFDAVGFSPNGDTVFVDDEGLYASQRALFTISGYPQPLVNKGLVLGCNENGDTTEPKTTMEWLEANVTFPNYAKIPAGGITTFDSDGKPHFESFGDGFEVMSTHDD